MTDASDTRLGSLPNGPLSHAEATALSGSDRFERVVPAGSLVVHDPERTLVVGLAIVGENRVVGAVYQPDDRAWHRVYGADADTDGALDAAIDAVEDALTGEGRHQSMDIDADTDARVSAVDPTDSDRLVAQFEDRA